MCENEGFIQFVNNHSGYPYNAYTTDFREVRGKSSVIAFLIGMIIITAAIVLGRTYAFYIFFLSLSILMTLLWRSSPHPWICLVAISAATPIAVTRQQFACNLIFALWFTLFNVPYLLKLPKWIYVPFVMAVIGIITSSINWISGDFLSNVMRQGTFAFNFFLAPFFLLPVSYLRMRESQDHVANLEGLLFCLIVPSTLLLISAKIFGTVTNEWEASLHIGSLPEGFLQYQLGKVSVNFLRTEVGFILAALICASTAVAVSQVKGLYRLLAGGCLASNAFLLLSTGSFGSGLACCCGLTGIFYCQLRAVSVAKAIVPVVVICCMLLLTYGLAPSSVKNYLGKRYEHRVTNADTDRLELWARAVEHFFQHPEGIGFTLSVGGKVKSFIHNDYLVYAVSYGFIGGLAYVIVVVGLLTSFFKVRKSAIDDPAALAVHLAGLGVVVAIAVNSITDHMNSNRWYFNVIWSVIWYSYFCRSTVQPLKV